MNTTTVCNRFFFAFRVLKTKNLRQQVGCSFTIRYTHTNQLASFTFLRTSNGRERAGERVNVRSFVHIVFGVWNRTRFDSEDSHTRRESLCMSSANISRERKSVESIDSQQLSCNQFFSTMAQPDPISRCIESVAWLYAPNQLRLHRIIIIRLNMCACKYYELNGTRCLMAHVSMWYTPFRAALHEFRM